MVSQWQVKIKIYISLAINHPLEQNSKLFATGAY